MKLFWLIIFLGFWGLFSCCNRTTSTMKQLEMIESVMTVDPDSAWSLLSQMNSSQLPTGNERILYGYLNTIIPIERSSTDQVNDSIATLVYDYAINHKDRHLKAKAAFLKGVSLYRHGDMREAVICLFDALNWLENTEDLYLEGRINDLIAIVYFCTFKPGPGIKYANRAKECFETLGNNRRVLYSRAILAKLLHGTNNHHQAIDLASDIVGQTEYSNDSIVRFEALTTLANSYIHTEEYEKGIEVFRIIDEEGIMTPYYEGEYIFALVLNGNVDVAEKRLDKTINEPPLAQLVKAREVYFLAVGDTVNAYKQLAILTNWQSDVMANTMDDGIIDSVEESYQKDKALKAAELHAANTTKWAIVICSSIILFGLAMGGTWYHRRSIGLKNKELDLKMEEVQRLSNSVEDARLHNEVIAKEISTLFKKQWTTLNILCNEYFEKGANPTLKATILTEVEKEIKRISGREGLKSIEDALDHHFDGVITKLKQQLPELDKKDLAFITFTYAGFSPRAICLFTGFTIKYYYKKRAVIKEKILASEAVDRQMFVDLLG